MESATEKGHLDQKRQGLRSTKIKVGTNIESKDAPITRILIMKKTHEVYIALEEIKVKIYSNQTGTFPSTSNRGMKYVMIFFIFTMLTTLKEFQTKTSRKQNSYGRTRKCTTN